MLHALNNFVAIAISWISEIWRIWKSRHMICCCPESDMKEAWSEIFFLSRSRRYGILWKEFSIPTRFLLVEINAFVLSCVCTLMTTCNFRVFCLIRSTKLFSGSPKWWWFFLSCSARAMVNDQASSIDHHLR